MRSDISLPVMGVTLLLAAVLQDMISVSLWIPVKLNFLSVVALFYMLTRPFVKAILAVVWAGALTDALGGLPPFCTIGFLLCAYGAVHGLRSMIYRATVLSGVILGAGLGCGQTLWTRIWAGASGGAGGWHNLSLPGYSILVGAVVGGVGFAICLLIDRLSGCVQTAKEKNDLSWSKAD
ncbi:MAG: hypothetical protein PHO37_07805 [Kiritimatiellae bacterium]|nr:hypothetical protein [Kiritimatiellia bacterium]